MVSTIITVAAFVLTTGAVIATLAEYWQDIVNWLKKCIDGIKRAVEGVLYGFKVFIKKVSEGMQEISRYYSKNGEQWEETTRTRTISIDEVPEEIRMKARTYETDITNDVNEQLELAS